MKAKLISEKFIEKSDPIKDMDIGYDMTKYVKSKLVPHNMNPNYFWSWLMINLKIKSIDTFELFVTMLEKSDIQFQMEFLDDHLTTYIDEHRHK